MRLDSETRQRHMYARNALICFGVTAACIVIDIKNFISAGRFYLDWKIGFSFVLYIVLAAMGVRALKKLQEIKKKKSDAAQ